MSRAAALLALFVAAAALSHPLTDVPVIDDWAYAYSVDKMLANGEFRVLDYSCRYNLVQVLWGALFSLPTGMSFVALRLSTFVLAACGILAFYDLVRSRTHDTSLAFWCAALLAFNPLFFRLSLSFMTDVPLLALVAMAFWMLDRSVRSGNPIWLAAALIVAVAGYLVRELAIVAPVAILIGAAFAEPARRTFTSVTVLGGVAALGLAAELWWIRSHGATWGLDARTEGLRHVFDVAPALYGSALLHMLLTAAALVAPLTFASLRSRRDVAVAVVGGAVCVALALFVGAVPFGEKEVLSPLGLGMTRALMPGTPDISQAGQVLRAVGLALGAGSLALLLRQLLEVVRGATARIAAALAGRSSASDDGVTGIDVAWTLFVVGQVAALMILWLWQDRYDLVLVPSALWLASLRAARFGWDRTVLGVGVAAFAALSVLGTRDDFELNRAAWEAESSLRHQGVAARDIDAGYVLNGWRLYAYAEQFAPGYQPERVPFLFSKDELAYAVSSSAVPGEVLHIYSWPRTWLSEPRLYVVRR